ncbi:hypothetical protein ZIOFF_072738 [Zingiber officinale]|uniref:Polyprotein n=1 Tax=Zingiber officinale TaxID=94328 RepID=A0A8J5C8G9_ZINOF|nr:hypothetical protein ZIOFF_072738 [Zingiber officinale]
MEVNIRNLIDGRISINFSNYTAARDCTLEDEEERKLIAVLTKISYEESYTTPTEKHPAIDVNIDYEEDPTEIIASSEAYPYILVHRLSSTSTMLKPKSSGAAGLDLNKTVIIEPRGRALVSTGLSLEIPWEPMAVLQNSLQCSESPPFLEYPSEDLAWTTSPWASIPRSKDPSMEILEEEDLAYIQYLAQLSAQQDTIQDFVLNFVEQPKLIEEMTTIPTTQDPPVTTITRRIGTEETPLFEDQIRDYRQRQRRRYNMQRAIRRLSRRFFGGESYNTTLEQQMDPQTQLRLSMQERASIVPAEVLYHSRQDDAHHRVYVHRAEEAVLVTNNQVDRTFIQPESFQQLQRSGMRFLLMGVIQVRIQILHRQEEGTLALVVFRDNRWQGDQAIFATMEIDLTHGTQLVYVIPDTMLTISDFYRNIQISILARGNENWQNGEANLLITRGLEGRLSNTPNMGFTYEVQNVVDYLTSHGVRALAGRRYNTRDALGQNWVIRQSSVNIPMQPTEVNTRNLLDGSVALRFENYQVASPSSKPRYNNQDEEIQSDEEEIRSHTLAVFIQQEPLIVKILPRALGQPLLPRRATPE